MQCKSSIQQACRRHTLLSATGRRDGVQHTFIDWTQSLKQVMRTLSFVHHHRDACQMLLLVQLPVQSRGKLKEAQCNSCNICVSVVWHMISWHSYQTLHAPVSPVHEQAACHRQCASTAGETEDKNIRPLTLPT